MKRQHMIGPGRRSVFSRYRQRSKYDGATLRQLRADRGCGKPRRDIVTVV